MKVPGIVGGTTITPLLAAANVAEPDSTVAPVTPLVMLSCWTYRPLVRLACAVKSPASKSPSSSRQALS